MLGKAFHRGKVKSKLEFPEWKETWKMKIPFAHHTLVNVMWQSKFSVNIIKFNGNNAN